MFARPLRAYIRNNSAAHSKLPHPLTSVIRKLLLGRLSGWLSPDAKAGSKLTSGALAPRKRHNNNNSRININITVQSRGKCSAFHLLMLKVADWRLPFRVYAEIKGKESAPARKRGSNKSPRRVCVFCSGLFLNMYILRASFLLCSRAHIYHRYWAADVESSSSALARFARQ